MKKHLLFFIVLFLCSAIYAQKEIWSTVGYYDYGNANFNTNGVLQKCNLDGTNPEIVHAFDFSEGKTPMGRLFVASNNKLYGTTYLGGIVPAGDQEGYGCIYEYDLILDRFRIVSHPGDGISQFGAKPQVGLIEPIVGKLYGCGLQTTGTYDLTTGMTAHVANTPVILQGSVQNPVRGELMKASDGLLYGCTAYYSSCPANSPFIGTIIRVDPVNNAYSVIYPFNCNYINGAGPYGSLVEGAPGKLYGTTITGGANGVDFPALGDGVLFEYNIQTNTYTKKFDFNILTLGVPVGPIIKATDGKLYGLSSVPIYSTTQIGDLVGTIYSYDPITNLLTVLHSFYYSLTPQNLGTSPIGSLLKASDGSLYGYNSSSIFKYDPLTNQTTYLNNVKAANDLLEICRKPRYHFFDVDTFDGCIGGAFSYDIQNTNAATYQWLKDGAVVGGQTGAILNLTNLTANNAGSYTCLMTNECGTTTTMPLYLTVNCLGTQNIAKLSKSVKLYPNPTSSVLHIELYKNIDIRISSCTITNLLGQTVYQAATANKIDVSQLQKGIYIVSLKTNYGDWNGKFVKE